MPGKHVSATITVVALVLLICRTESSANETRTFGLVTATGSVNINQVPAISGQTLFTDSTITTVADSSLILDVAGASRLEVSENTEVKVGLSSGSIHANLKQGQLTCATRSGTSLDIEIGPGISVVAEAATPSQFTITAQEESFELRVNAGKVDVRDSKAQKITRVDPGMKYSTSAGLAQNTNTQNSLSEGKRAAIFAVAGGALALLFIVIVTGADPVADGPGGCVIVPSGMSPQNPC
jgi:hypothetical protein